MRRILAVDEEVGACSLVARLLNHFGYKARFTDDWESATELLDRFAPHLVIASPTISGPGGVSLIEYARSAYPFLPVVAMARRARSRQDIAGLGFDGYVRKPIVLTQLLREVKSTLTRRSRSVLVVDDVDEVRAILAEFLDGLALDVVDVASAEEAIDVLRSRPIDLVISDCAMPGMIGTEFLAYVKEHYPDLRFIVASASFPIEEISRLRPDGFLRKPFDLDDLTRLVRSSLS